LPAEGWSSIKSKGGWLRRMDRVLIVDDDVALCRLLAERLSTEGFAIEAVHDGPRGLERALSMEHALVVLDLMLPGLGGLDVLRRLRAQSSVPVLILTARGEDVERILGLEIGADDYLPKPFNPRELIARIRAILRRTVRVATAAEPLTVGDLRLDPAAREVWLNDARLDLTSVEFTLLEALLRDAGHVLTREHLTETVLGRRLGSFDRVIDVHVSNLRRKLGHAQTGDRIKAVRGSGYLFVARSEVR
jgi:DNA-binding response OmpR family regulator